MKKFAVMATILISAITFGNAEAATTPLYSRSDRDAYYEQRRRNRY